METFPIDLSGYKPLSLTLSDKTLSKEQENQLLTNIDLVRDVIVFFTAYANAKGLGGHTGGAYDIVPEVLIVDGFMRGSDNIVPVFYDEAGHRVAIQYAMAALDERTPGMTTEDLLHYREHGSGLPGHPELDLKRGIKFSSGRLGHLFSYVNGVAENNPSKKVILFGSDGSQMEGNDAEAARYLVANRLNVKLILDDNDVTIEGHPSEYMLGFDLAATLDGHGIPHDIVIAEDIDFLYQSIFSSLQKKGPFALINKRKMAPGIAGIEGTTKGHDAVPVSNGIDYLKEKGHTDAVAMIESVTSNKSSKIYLGSSEKHGKNRSEFGVVIADLMGKMSDDDREKVLVISSDLGGSCGLNVIGDKFPKRYRMGGVMERNNYSVAAGFGSKTGYQGIIGTFSAFSEMLISEITMARLNESNVLAHFSHAGVDDMADNTCHFGINNFFVDNGLPEGDETKLYFPADALQMKSVLEKIFSDQGLRFIFSTRSSVPYILDENGNNFFDPANGYTFVPGKDEIIREGDAGYIVSYGEMLYRALDAVEQLRKENINVGLVNKPTLNVIDEDMLAKIGQSGFALVVESQNEKTGLGSKYGSWLLERGHKTAFAYAGTVRPGDGGVIEQIGYQGLESEGVIAKVKALLK